MVFKFKKKTKNIIKKKKKVIIFIKKDIKL